MNKKLLLLGIVCLGFILFLNGVDAKCSCLPGSTFTGVILNHNATDDEVDLGEQVQMGCFPTVIGTCSGITVEFKGNELDGGGLQLLNNNGVLFDLASGETATTTSNGNTWNYVILDTETVGDEILRCSATCGVNTFLSSNPTITITEPPAPPAEETNVVPYLAFMAVLIIGLLYIFGARMFDNEHFLFRIFLMFMGAFMIVIGLNMGYSVASLGDPTNSTLTTLEIGYTAFNWTLYVSIGAFALGILIFALNRLRKSGNGEQ